jgi:hypothetical protein
MVVLTAVFWRWLKIATFDEGFAEALGIPAAAVGFGLVIASALAAVAAFEAVGSIIVIAMFICPPATARLMTSRPRQQVLWSVVFAAVSAILGYVLAGYGPLWLGAADSVSAAGMIATVSGALLGLPAFSDRTAAGSEPPERLTRLIPRRRALHPAGFTAPFVNSVRTSCRFVSYCRLNWRESSKSYLKDPRSPAAPALARFSMPKMKALSSLTLVSQRRDDRVRPDDVPDRVGAEFLISRGDWALSFCSSSRRRSWRW